LTLSLAALPYLAISSPLLSLPNLPLTGFPCNPRITLPGRAIECIWCDCALPARLGPDQAERF
jgi:hypothetical protein